MYIGVDRNANDHLHYILKRCSFLEEIKMNPGEDYCEIAERVSQIVINNNKRGVLICNSGIGVCTVANKISGIIAGLCHNEEVCENVTQNNGMNILCLSAKYTTPEICVKIINMFKNTSYLSNTKNDYRKNKINQTPDILLTPALNKLHPLVVQEMQKYPIAHRNNVHFRTIYNDILNQLNMLLNIPISYNTFLMTGSGSTGVEALISYYSPLGLLVLDNGLFGERWFDVSKRYDSEASVIKQNWGESFEEKNINKIIQHALKYEKKAIVITHHETSTGCINDIHNLARQASKVNIHVIVDAVSSAGIINIDINCGISALACCSNKGIGAPSGISIITFKKYNRIGSYSYIFDMDLHSQNTINNETKNTPSLPILYGLHSALKLLRPSTEKLIELKNYIINNLKNMEYEIFPTSSPSIIMVYIDPKFVKFCYNNNIIIYPGKGLLSNKIVQIGLYGLDANQECIDKLINVFYRWKKSLIKVHLVRHELRNPDDFSFETELNEKGLQNSNQSMANKLKYINSKGNFYSSVYPRVIQTLAPYLKKYKIKAIVKDELHELLDGQNDDIFHTVVDIPQNLLDLVIYKQTLYDFPKLENKKYLLDRIIKFITDEKTDLENSIICSHLSTLCTIYYLSEEYKGSKNDHQWENYDHCLDIKMGEIITITINLNNIF